MNLGKKKSLAMRTFGVGRDRIVFIESRIDEIKDAITKQDMRDLNKSGAVLIKEVKGRRSTAKSNGRGIGNIRKRPSTEKRKYMTLTRKLRKYVAILKESNKISREQAEGIRKKIRNKDFRSKAHMIEYLGETKK